MRDSGAAKIDETCVGGRSVHVFEGAQQRLHITRA